MSLAARPPKFFVARSLGRIAVADRLRAAGWDLVTFAGYYGDPVYAQVTDSRWISDAAGHGWPILMKDARIRHRQAAIDLIIEYQARCFVIARDGLTSAGIAERFLASQRAIFDAAARTGPYIYVVQSGRLDWLSLHRSEPRSKPKARADDHYRDSAPAKLAT